MRDLEGIPPSSGATQLRRHLAGERLTQRQAILAKCCDCMGYYVDGRRDCRVSACALYPWMPYRQKSILASAEATTAPPAASISLRTGSGPGAVDPGTPDGRAP